MSKRLSYLTAFFGLCLASAYCDGGDSEIAAEVVSAIEAVEIQPLELTSGLAPTSVTEDVSAPTTIAAPVAIEQPFSPFTGKIKRQKVRLRASADLDSPIVKELHKGELLVVNGKKGDFYAVDPPAGTKAYVFRSFVLDGVVEGNRVNVRFAPSLDAPVIGHLNSGDRIQGQISSLNNKWFEISTPPGTRFYVAKEFVESIGGPELKIQLDKRRNAAEQLLDAATLLTQVEMKKSFPQMEVDQIKNKYQTVMADFNEFPDLVDKAKEAFNVLNEEYTQRKIAFLEDKADGKTPIEEEKSFSFTELALNPTDRMKMWEPVEESIYLGWASRNEDRSLDEFYADQRQNAVKITGFVEAYTAPVKNKPADHIVKNGDLPMAYVYSTQVNLQEFAGKKVTLLVTPRSNNNFAFPAYFVLSVE
ncbi:MAG TPA: hypothetical protein VHK67_02580 [Rhabdochlamydiaceae bacterium]|jgi:uncharacterized protein YgiM (DUF1202 family)|nr:hypothetical protein [Rhabdochlamydiaceae bacterium]